MNFIKQFTINNKIFIFLYFFLIIAISPFLIIYSKSEIHLTINQFHNVYSDIFFKYITYLGDGIVPLIIALFFLFYSFRKAILIVVSGSFAGLVAQFFKQLVFIDASRPIKYLADYPLHLIDGVQMYTSHSFPSGHSATIFALCLTLATITSSLLKKIVLFCAAVLVAFSRVYLSQHFLVDAYAGSIIGTVSAIFVVYILNRQKAVWIDKSIPQIIKSTRKDEQKRHN